jgi:DNA invertase Pin-like site-specific DNA recombinase
MKKAIGYVRVSTDEQAAEGVSLAAQRAKIKAYCTLKDLELVQIIEEGGGKSAKNLDRPGFKTVLDLTASGQTDAVVIVKLDRAFRNTVDALTVAKDFDQRGVALHSISESLDTRSALGKFFFTLTAALAEMERGLISERTKAALAHKKTNGERVGKIPVGFRLCAETGKLVKCQQERSVLARIRKWRKRGL